jgi:hypothetical protein
MGPVLYGYRSGIGRAIIDAQEALIVRAILTAKPRERAAAVRFALEMLRSLGTNIDMPESTIKTRIREVLKNRRKYHMGKPAKDRQPQPELKLA